mgnify:CR=1 FL=1
MEVNEPEDLMNTNFKVTKIPIGILKKFKKLCKERYGDIYWVGISELLNIQETYEQILTQFSFLQAQIDELKKAGDKKKLKTFGEYE